MNIVHTNTLYLIRHGENPANLTKEFSYKLVDYSLTPKGVLQAQQTAEYFKKKPGDAIYSSPLKRAQETAEPIAQVINSPVTLIEEFREVNVGDLEKSKPTLENWEFHDQVLRDWLHGHPERSFPNGENYLTLIDRIQRGLLKTVTGRDRHHIVIVAHGGTIAAAVHHLCPDDIKKGQGYGPMGNCAITEIELTHSGDQLSGRLVKWAASDHLSGEAAKLISGTPQVGDLL